MNWLLRSIAVAALTVAIAQSAAIVIDELDVAKLPEPSPSAEPRPTPSAEPSTEPSAEPSPEPTPEPPLVDVEVDVDPPPLPVVIPTTTPPPPPPPPPPPHTPSCVAPGGSGDAVGHRNGWEPKGRECAGNQKGGIIFAVPVWRKRWNSAYA